jgi:ferredoxin
MADGGDIREAMLDVLYSGVDAREVLDTSVPSHMRLELDEETKKPVLPRMTYVDEQTCIGCKNCACVAKNTFFMEDDFGKARVYQQGGDTVEDIAIAIDTCPVNCIHYV